MPVICPRCQSRATGAHEEETHHDDERITREEPSVNIRNDADSEGAAKAGELEDRNSEYEDTYPTAALMSFWFTNLVAVKWLVTQPIQEIATRTGCRESEVSDGTCMTSGRTYQLFGVPSRVVAQTKEYRVERYREEGFKGSVR